MTKMETSSLRIAIISDLHAGADNSPPSMRTDGRAGAPPHSRDCAAKLLEHVRANAIKADALIVPGDLSNKAQSPQFEKALSYIGAVASALGCSKESIFIVPGNHDVDWEVLSLSDRETRWHQRYDPFKRSLQKAEMSLNGEEGLFNTPFLAYRRSPRLLVALFNSSWHDSVEEAHHRGRIAIEHVEEFDRILEQFPVVAGQYRAFVTHHHPAQYTDLAISNPDSSVMVNSELLLAVLQKHRFDLYLHGHRHQAHFQTRSIDAGHPIVLVGAGTVSKPIDSALSGIARNVFHVVEIDGRAADSGAIRGALRTLGYDSLRDRWEALPPNMSVGPVQVFGEYVLPTYIEGKITQFLLDLRPGNLRKLSVLLGQCEQLRHVPITAMRNACVAVAKRINASFVDQLPSEYLFYIDEQPSAALGTAGA